MKELLTSKYILFACTVAFFTGCLLTSFGYMNIYILLPSFILISLLIFINRRNRSVLFLSLLVIIMIFAAFEYYTAASKISSLSKFEGAAVYIEGVVASEPTETEYGYKLLLKNVNYIQDNKLFKCNEKLQLYVGKEERISFGDHIKALCKVEPVAVPRNFGDFDFKKYYMSKGIYMKATAQEFTILSENKGGFTATMLYKSNQKIKATIYKALPQTEAALLYGILTGSKSDIDEEVMKVFSLTGLAHILSVSGLHIGFLVLLLNFIFKPFKLNKQLKPILIFMFVLFYILLIGAPVPAVRALLMLAVLMLGTALGKKYNLIASASCSALLLLLFNPLYIHDPSFIISFACIYSIGFFHQPITMAIRFVPTWLRSSLALSIAVWIGITPVLITYFNYVSFINVLINVLAVPISFLITIAGFVAVVLGMVLPEMALFIFAVSYYLIKLLYTISEKASLLPFAGVGVPSLPLYIYSFYYMLSLMLIEDFWKLKSRSFKKNYILAGMLALTVVIFVHGLPVNAMKIYFIDVGQGDCSIIKAPNGKYIMVDGGGSSDWNKSYDVGEKLTVPALYRIGVWRIDTLIVTHIHDDHIGGALSALESFRVGQVLLPASDSYGEGEFASSNLDKLIELCKLKKIPITYLESGSSMASGKNFKISFLAPEKPYLKNTDSDVNNNSLVFKLSYKEFDILFTGDIQQEAEQRLLEKAIGCDVLKVAHHGSPYSSMENFLMKADPELSIISVGKNNYGHPSKDVLDRLQAEGSSVLRTDVRGAILLTTNGKDLKVRTVRQEK